ncbi:hypothetical protein [Streptomyces sp. NPDC096132]|uniref:hypothetical protein n=1 Tax=Streptomyces sp. NPDC096132 TaxID=3366075 RepID=UPI003814E296
MTFDQNSAVSPRRSSSLSFFAQAGSAAEQGADVVTHAPSQVGAAETVADAQEQVVEFTVPSRVGKVVDHAGRLPSSARRQFPMSIVGGVVRQDRP